MFHFGYKYTNTDTITLQASEKMCFRSLATSLSIQTRSVILLLFLFPNDQHYPSLNTLGRINKLRTVRTATVAFRSLYDLSNVRVYTSILLALPLTTTPVAVFRRNK